MLKSIKQIKSMSRLSSCLSFLFRKRTQQDNQQHQQDQSQYLPPEPMQNHNECQFCDQLGSINFNCRHSACHNCLKNYLIMQKFDPNIKCTQCDQTIQHNVIQDILNEYTNTCSICYQIFEVEQTTQMCQCKICQSCMSKYVENLIQKGEVQKSKLVCPLCQTALKKKQVKALVSDKEYLRYLDLLAQLVRDKDQHTLSCPNCRFDFFVRRRKELVTCGNCGELFCAECGKNHQGECNQNALEGVTNCPKCREGVVRDAGCNFLTCPWPLCNGNTFFCYHCGKLLKKSGHFGHFTSNGPFGDTCNTMDKLQDKDQQQSC